MCANRQAEILHSAAAMVKPSGRLVYSTCTFAPEEDELAVENFLKTHPEFVAETVEAPWFVPGENGSYRMWPHKLLGEGHFAAVLRKTEGEEGEIPESKGEKLPKEWISFAKELGTVKKDRFEPAHALALWLQTCKNIQRFPADSEEMRAYIHGEVVPSEKKGWCLVCADDYAIGWGKGDGRVLKNHYPKGLRR